QVVIGTHALLSKHIDFNHLGLLIIDEEQRFGVEQKEKLKKLGADVHVLSLSATPIPRTLQMVLSGVRSLSMLSQPPVDRLSVRTFVMPFDHMVIGDAIRRERFRGGQIFCVCPRVSDLRRLEKKLQEMIPDLRILIAHGKLNAQELEKVMELFVDGKADLLLSTNIVENGLDVTNANTMIVYRADMFGLAQLHQLRGRIGRSKIRAYCYFTYLGGRLMNPTVKRRLETLQTLDSLGAGFTIASQDMDIRGAGNLLGEQQSGHIKEVGSELYLRMLEEAVNNHKQQLENNIQDQKKQSLKQSDGLRGEEFSSQLNLGVSAMIPEDYISDLSLRLSLYRRLASIHESDGLQLFKDEMIDRFGVLPNEFEQLIRVIEIKNLCQKAGIVALDAGVKGVVVRFYKDRFANLEGLIEFLNAQAKNVKLRPDHCLVVQQNWRNLDQRLNGIKQLAFKLCQIANQKFDQK
ncbi:MAG: TRCF domain-containing protein, partial [Pseudomonadota bacterium]